MSIDST